MKPYIICHMMASLDGRIDCDMTEQIESGDEYYDALAKLNCPSTLMGRVTMQMHYASAEPFETIDATPIGQEAFCKATESESYIIAIDTHGSLRWPTNVFDGQQLLVIVSEACPKQYLEMLDKQKISWIATGKNHIDLNRAMNLLGEKFGVKRLSVTGGGHINAAFLAAGLLDEVSMMYAPGIDARANMTAAFDGLKDMQRKPVKLKLTHVSQVGEGTVWMRYNCKF